MKIDLIKLIAFVWMCVMVYFTYEIWIDVKYIADLIHAYVSMAMQHVKH